MPYLEKDEACRRGVEEAGGPEHEVGEFSLSGVALAHPVLLEVTVLGRAKKKEKKNGFETVPPEHSSLSWTCGLLMIEARSSNIIYQHHM